MIQCHVSNDNPGHRFMAQVFMFLNNINTKQSTTEKDCKTDKVETLVHYYDIL